METEKVVKRGLLAGFIILFIGFMLNVCDTRASKDVNQWKNDTSKESQKDFLPKR